VPGYDEIIVGYRERDPMRDFADKLGGRCVSCSNLVWFNASAFPVLGGDDHSPTIVCRTCYAIERDFIDAAQV